MAWCSAKGGLEKRCKDEEAVSCRAVRPHRRQKQCCSTLFRLFASYCERAVDRHSVAPR